HTGRALHLARPRSRACKHLLPFIFHPDGHSRGAHDHRHRIGWHSCMAGPQRQVQARVLHASRTRRPVLALRGYCLGVSISSALSGASKLMIRTYIKVWAGLLILLALTVGAAYVHLGPFNTIAAVSIAVIKAAIIALYFMHLRRSPHLMWIFAGAGFFWL